MVAMLLTQSAMQGKLKCKRTSSRQAQNSTRFSPSPPDPNFATEIDRFNTPISPNTALDTTSIQLQHIKTPILCARSRIALPQFARKQRCSMGQAGVTSTPRPVVHSSSTRFTPAARHDARYDTLLSRLMHKIAGQACRSHVVHVSHMTHALQVAIRACWRTKCKHSTWRIWATHQHLPSCVGRGYWVGWSIYDVWCTHITIHRTQVVAVHPIGGAAPCVCVPFPHRRRPPRALKKRLTLMGMNSRCVLFE